MDGFTIAAALNELSESVSNGRVDKITQPEKDEIVLSARGRNENKKILLIANASAPRLHFTSASKTSPAQAPMFCMVLRKHLSGGRFVGFAQPDFERIAELHIESLNEMGDRSVKRLIIEIMGKHSNIILVDDRGIILDAAKHVTFETSSVREVLPGKAYERPPTKKISPLEADFDIFSQNVFETEKLGLKIQQALYQSFNGISPVAASEICLSAGVAPDAYAGELSAEERARLCGAFSNVISVCVNRAFSNHVYFDEKGKPFDYSVFPFASYNKYETKKFESVSETLEFFYSGRDAEYRLAQKTADLRKIVGGHIERCVRKKIMQQQETEEVRGRDKYRVFGELLTAYIHLVEKGAEVFAAQDFYDEGATVEIKLDPTLTAAENAQAYFKKYNKQKRAHSALLAQIESNESDLAWLESVSAAMQTAANEEDIAEIRAELAAQGYLKKQNLKRAGRAEKKSKPLAFISSDGFEIYVGKNNSQNDELTLRFAKANDVWLHTKDIAGSHVIVRTNNETPPERTLGEAANLAAFYSKGRNSAQVPVDYVIRKHVRKPNGAKPGFVIYDNHKTAYITPKEPSIRQAPCESP